MWALSSDWTAGGQSHEAFFTWTDSTPAAKMRARRRVERRPRSDLPDLSHIQRELDLTEAWLAQIERKYGITEDQK